ncbi:MAG: c-type cytochrome [Candidatus Puniceispirillaceae bacterium]|jgi:mono/diheme cytochrome c family protein
MVMTGNPAGAMKAALLWCRYLAGALCILAGVSPASADAERGRELAASHCTRCHVVGDINPYGGIESTPSFIGMKYLADWERRFEEFYVLPPHPALVRISEVSAERSEARPAFVHEIILTLEDVDAILAFVRTLPSPAR